MTSNISKCAFWFLLISLNIMLACGGGGGGGSTPPPPAEPGITTTTVPSATVGQAYSATIVATNVSSAATWKIDNGNSLPSGLTLSGTGTTATISGTPELAGTSTFGVTVTDGSKSARKVFTLAVQAAPAITTSTLEDAVVGQSYYATVSSTGLGQTPSWKVTTGALPPGMTLSTTDGWFAAITGTSTETGTYSFTLQVTNGTLTASKDFTLKVVPNTIAITTKSLPDGDTATYYIQGIWTARSMGSQTWSIIAGSLPPGISVGIYSGMLTGRPTKVGTYPFTVQVQDSQSTATADLSITVALAPLSIQTDWSVRDALTGSYYWIQFNTLGGSGTKTWSVSDGALPTGTALNASNGKLDGILTTPGTYSFTVRVDDESGFAAQAYTMHVVDPLVVTTTALPKGSVDTPYSFQLHSTGGLGTISWYNGYGAQLPPGITLTKEGLLQGTPGLPWNANPLILQAMDSSSSLQQSASAYLTLAIEGPMVITTKALPAAVVNRTYSAPPIHAYGGVTPYTWSLSAGTLPPGLTLDPKAGTITGTPTGPAADSSFTVKVVDSSTTPQSATRDLSIHTQNTLGRNDTIQTATFVNGYMVANGSISPYDDSPNTVTPDQDYYRIATTAGKTLQFSMYNFGSMLDPVVEIVDENGQRLQTCWNDSGNKSQPCLIDYHGVNAPPSGSPIVIWLDVPGNTETVFYVHVLDYFGNARPDFTYQLYLSDN